MAAHQASLSLGFSRQEHRSGVAIFFSNAWKWKVKVKSLSHVWLLATPWTAAYQAPPSIGFSRQEYWSGVPLPSPPQLCSLSQYCLLPHEKPHSFLLPQQPCPKHPPARITVIRLWHSTITDAFNTKGIHIDGKLQGKWAPGIAGSRGLDTVFRNLSPLLSSSFLVLTSF